MKQSLKKIAFRFARSKPGGWLVWFILRYFPFLIPFKKLYQDQYLIAISHPVPSYATHILILPRIYLPDILALNMHSEMGEIFVQSIYKALKVLLADIKQTYFQLVINGGEYQDVKLLHMHLIENHLDITKSEKLHANDRDTALSELLFLAKEHIQNTECSTYRLIFLFQENQIQLQLQMM